MTNKAGLADHNRTTATSDWLADFRRMRAEDYAAQCTGPRDGHEKRLADTYQEASEAEFARLEKVRPGRPESSYTYFARGMDTGNIKIGRSFHLVRRMYQLTYQRGEKVELLATLRGGHLEEPYHELFADLWVDGEWFAPHPDLLAEIERINGATA